MGTPCLRYNKKLGRCLELGVPNKSAMWDPNSLTLQISHIVELRPHPEPGVNYFAILALFIPPSGISHQCLSVLSYSSESRKSVYNNVGFFTA